MAFYSERQSRIARSFADMRSSTSIRCGCGITHFTTANGHGDFEPGEIDELREAAAKEPDKVFEHTEFDYFDWGVLNNRTFVVGCPCGYDEKIAAHIESCSEQLIAYLTLLREDQAKELKASLAQAEQDVAKLKAGERLC